MSFSTRLRELRQARGLTMDVLGAQTHIHPAQISRLERGLQPSVDAVVRLARALGINPHELMVPVIDHAVANSPTLPVTQ